LAGTHTHFRWWANNNISAGIANSIINDDVRLPASGLDTMHLTRAWAIRHQTHESLPSLHPRTIMHRQTTISPVHHRATCTTVRQTMAATCAKRATPAPPRLSRPLFGPTCRTRNYIYIERERVDIATATTRFDISYSSSRIQQINDEKTLVASVV
jgi:hypothetical protein